MLLRETAIETRTINALAKKNIKTVEDMLRIVPRKYYDFRTIYTAKQAMQKGGICAVAGILANVKKSSTSKTATKLSITITDAEGTVIRATWFGRADLYERFSTWKNKEIVIGGTIIYHPQYGYQVQNPVKCLPRYMFPLKLDTVYPGIKGVSDEKLRNLIETYLSTDIKDPVPKQYIEKYKLPEYREALRKIHYPKSEEDIIEAEHRLLFNDLLYYALKLELQSRESAVGTPYSPKKMSITRDYINSLPYQMTDDQNKIFEDILSRLKEGKRVQGLLQGDVGYGKTLCAFLCMLLMAESGFQSALMAPTTVLARQHYTELKEIGEKYGYKTAFLGGDTTAKEKKEYIAGIESGKYHFVVGTTGLVQKDVKFKELGFVITDEEQKFGVVQRDELTAKANRGVNVLSMSATPVPRSLAMALYGTKTEVYELRTRPSGRKETQTAFCRSDEAILKHIEEQVKEGRQIYVVCPYITKGEIKEVEEEDKKEVNNCVITVEDTYALYSKYFANSPNVVVDTATGKMTADELNQKFADFKSGKINILISTTIVEVGVNVPNSSTIVICSAERFGLSCLHQLRGRVGRGKYKGYCILRVSDLPSEKYQKAKNRLQILVDSTSGFEIAKADLENRKAGNFIGMEQTGKNKYVDLMLENEKLFAVIRKIAAAIVDNGQEEFLIRLVEEN